MALPRQDTTGTPIPVILTSAWTAGLLVEATKVGYVTMPDGTKVSPLDFYTDIFPEPNSPQDPAPPKCFLVLMILSALATPLSLVEMHDLVHGSQAGYPVVSDLRGSTLTTHEIPASRLHPLDSTATLYGLGMWGFNAPLDGVEGAMALCYNGNVTDPQSKQAVGPFVGVSWRIGGTAPDRYGVTADVAANHGTLDLFYQATIANASDNTLSDKGQDIVIQCHDCTVAYKPCLLVWVRRRLPWE